MEKQPVMTKHLKKSMLQKSLMKTAHVPFGNTWVMRESNLMVCGEKEL